MKRLLVGLAFLLTGVILAAQPGVTVGFFDRIFWKTEQAEAARLCYVRVQLSDAQIKALPTTPIPLVAAPATRVRIKPIAATIFLDTLNGAYSNVNSTYAAIAINWHNASFAAIPIVNDNTLATPLTGATTLLTTVSQQIMDFNVPYLESVDNGAQGGIGDYARTYFDTNQPSMTIGAQGGDGSSRSLEISMDNNGSGNLTGGNGLNNMRVGLYYVREAF